MTRKTVYIVLGIALLALFFYGGAKVYMVITKGKQVGPDSNQNANGLVIDHPTNLLDQTNTWLASHRQPSLTMGEYALARALRSEHGNSTDEVRTWVGWAIRNAAGGPSNIFSKLTKSKLQEYSGYFAKQHLDGRYAATNQSPLESDVAIARAVYNAPQSADPTRGATNFFSPKTQDLLFQKAQAGDTQFHLIRKDAAAVRSNWESQGLVSLGAPASAKPDEVEFFGKLA